MYGTGANAVFRSKLIGLLPDFAVMVSDFLTSPAAIIRRRGRGPRLRCGVPHVHYKAITFVFGLRLRGAVAPKAYDHAMNAATFEAWLEHCLLPTLEEGDIVVLDNLKAHKSPRVAEILAGPVAICVGIC